MEWKRYRLEIREEAEEAVNAILFEEGVQGVEIEDKIPLTDEDKKRMFVDILPDIPESDGLAHIIFYLDPAENPEEIIRRIRKRLDRLRDDLDPGPLTLEVGETREEDWINNWKKYFHQFYVDDILIIPSWEKVRPEDENRIILHIDPGTAFGTGMHETTQLCIRALEKYLKKGDRILDIGTGSGILAITALKLGASRAIGTDLDPAALHATHENMRANGLSEEKLRVEIGDISREEELQEKIGRASCDIVLANILAEVLIPMMPSAAATIKPDGIYITSGILEEKEKAVIAAGEASGLRHIETLHQKEWVSVIFRK